MIFFKLSLKVVHNFSNCCVTHMPVILIFPGKGGCMNATCTIVEMNFEAKV